MQNFVMFFCREQEVVAIHNFVSLRNLVSGFSVVFKIRSNILVADGLFSKLLSEEPKFNVFREGLFFVELLDFAKVTE